MGKKRMFKVISWDDLPEGHPVSEEFDLICACGWEAVCPVAAGSCIEARIGMGFITDPGNPPSSYYAPAIIKCRKCGREYSRE